VQSKEPLHELHLGRRPERHGKSKTAFNKRNAGC
jgi:hypothetical protein